MLSKQLEMRPEDAEIWLVNLIRNTHLDAKIDSERDLIVIHKPQNSLLRCVPRLYAFFFTHVRIHRQASPSH